MNFICINKFNHTISFSMDLNSCITGSFSFKTCSYNRSFRTNNGTAWRCMFDPIKARLASSCSRKGINEALKPTIWFGATSMIFHFCLIKNGKSPVSRLTTFSSTKFPFSSSGAFACAIFAVSSSSALRKVRFLHIHFTIFYFTVRCFNETHLIDLSMNTK